MSKKRAIAYIDGYNLYHYLNDQLKMDHYKWLDIRMLLNIYIDKKLYDLVDIKYFTAPTWKTDSSKSRQNRYIKALKCLDVKVIEGYFQEEKVCDYCPKKSHKEKQTDVNISISMVDDAHTNSFDQCVLVSADQDMLPAFKLIKERFSEKELKVIRPQKHNRPIDPRKNINGLEQCKVSEDAVRKSLLPEKLKGTDGMVKRPKEYKPPPRPEKLMREYKQKM